MEFKELGLIEPLLTALTAAGHVTPTPIQAESVPLLLAGRDLCGTAQTGTGKTAAFALPILQSLAATPAPATGVRTIRALILAPTRELAVQIDGAFAMYGAHLPTIRHTVVYGGMKMRAQRRAVSEGTDILVATPGRLIDLVGQGVVLLGDVRHLVLDEADRMLDLGFLNDVRTVIKRLPAARQTILFSATLPKDIELLISQILRNPARVSVAAPSAPAEGVDQRVLFLEHPAKRAALLQILADPTATRALVFVRTRAGADRLTASLRTAKIRADSLHADRPQPERLRALDGFARGELQVLVATEIASRGLDVDDVSHVINYDMPNVPESYVHRIGRTARGGSVGIAISFCTGIDRPALEEIERLTNVKLTPLNEAPVLKPRLPGDPKPPGGHPRQRSGRPRR
jgi:ATP-dependent RNA helicase RhlE